jgi:hypothetical protein
MNLMAARGHFGGPDTKLVCFGNSGTASGKSFSPTPVCDFFFPFFPWSGKGFNAGATSAVVVLGIGASFFSTTPLGMRPAVSAAEVFDSLLPEIS